MEKKLTAGLEALTVEVEQQEILTVLNGEVKPMVTLKKELPQKDYKLVDDVPTHVGYIEMYTVLTPYNDSKGRNRQFSTFSLIGLAEIGLDLKDCKIEG